MSLKRRLSCLCLAAGAVLTMQPRAAHAYCLEGPLFTDDGLVAAEFPVYLYAPSGTIVGQPADVVEHELIMAIQHWHAASNAAFRPYYAGMTTNPDPKGRVVVREDVTTTGNDECESVDYPPPLGTFTGCERTTTSDEKRVGSTVWLIHQLGDPWPVWAVAMSITHEIGHSWGLDDTYGNNCNGGEFEHGGVMGKGACFDVASLGLDDQLGMQDLYGNMIGIPMVRQTSDDMLDWSVPGFDPEGITFDYPLGSSSSALPLDMFALAREDDLAEVVSVCESSSCAAVDFTPILALPRNMVSLATKSTKEYAVAFMWGESQWSCERNIFWAITEDSGASFAYRWVQNGSGVTTNTAGLTATYDPTTDRYVMAFRGDSGFIEIATIEAANPYEGAPQLVTDIIPWRTPNIECSDPSLVGGSDNCLLVWLGNEAFHPVHDTRVSIDSSGEPFVSSFSARVHPIHGFSMPAITETRDPDFPWLMALQQGGAIHTFRRGAGLDDEWQDETQITDGSISGLVAPTVSLVEVDGQPEYHVRFGL